MLNCFKFILLTASCVLPADAIYSQSRDSVSRSFSVGMGAKHYRLIDEAFSHQRVKYHSTTFMLALAHQRLTDKYFFMAEANAGAGNASASDQRPGGELIYVHIAIAYVRNVLHYKAMKTSSRLYIGGQLASSNFVIENVDQDDELTLTVYHTLNLFLFQSTMISTRNHLEFSLSLPLLGFTKRASYDGRINQDLEEEYKAGVIHLFVDRTKFSSVNPLALPQLAIDFVHRIGQKTDFVIGYEFNYLKNTEIAPIHLYSNTLMAKLRFNFNKYQ